MTNFSNTAAIILAAGKGTRIKAKNKNKVAFKIGGKPIIEYVVDKLEGIGLGQIVVIVGFQADSIKAVLGDRVLYVKQEKQLGTGDAIKSALPALKANISSVISLYGDDSAFYTEALLKEMIAKKEKEQIDLLFLTINKDDPTGLGRIVRSKNGKVLKIVEEKSASKEEKAIKEINTGLYCFNRKFLDKYAHFIKKNKESGEYYATDLVEIALSAKKSVATHYYKDSSVWLGVNNKSDLQKAINKKTLLK